MINPDNFPHFLNIKNAKISQSGNRKHIVNVSSCDGGTKNIDNEVNPTSRPKVRILEKINFSLSDFDV